MLENIRYISVDAGLLLLEEAARARARRCIGSFSHLNPQYLFITHGTNALERRAAFAFIEKMGLTQAKVVQAAKRIEEQELILNIVGGDRGQGGLSWRIGVGKRILHLGIRRSGFIDVYRPPPGIVCHRFYKLVLTTGCPYDCAYCYLQLTLRIIPYVRHYLNLEKLWRELARFSRRIQGPVVLNTGELADSLAIDPMTDTVNEVICEISKYNNLQLLLLTKSSNVDHLQRVNNGRVILSASLTMPENAQAFEQGTAPSYTRIDGLHKAELKGYRTRCRIDPIICAGKNWEEKYEEMIGYLLRKTNVEMITLGQPRFYSPLLKIIDERHPQAGKVFTKLATDTTLEGRRRPAQKERLRIYEKVLDMIWRKKEGALQVMVCKETPEIVRELKRRFQISPKHCNCI